MKLRNRSNWIRLGLAGVTIFLMMACGLSSNADTAATPGDPPAINSITSTPTVGIGIPEGTSSNASRCEGLIGQLEMQVLVGPADVVGLEPIAVGEIPFAVVAEGEMYLVQGNGTSSYQEILEKDWGTYTVSFDMVGTLEGECSGQPGSEELNIIVEMSGEQMVEVRAEGFQGDYPWSGTQNFDLSFPLEDGATVEGEGWAFILHLSK